MPARRSPGPYPGCPDITRTDTAPVTARQANHDQPAEAPSDEVRSISEDGMLPDPDTSETVLYGSSYSFVRNTRWVWASMDDYLARKERALLSQVPSDSVPDDD